MQPVFLSFITKVLRTVLQLQSAVQWGGRLQWYKVESQVSIPNAEYHRIELRADLNH